MGAVQSPGNTTPKLTTEYACYQSINKRKRGKERHGLSSCEAKTHIKRVLILTLLFYRNTFSSWNQIHSRINNKYSIQVLYDEWKSDLILDKWPVGYTSHDTEVKLSKEVIHYCDIPVNYGHAFYGLIFTFKDYLYFVTELYFSINI